MVLIVNRILPLISLALALQFCFSRDLAGQGGSFSAGCQSRFKEQRVAGATSGQLHTLAWMPIATNGEQCRRRGGEAPDVVCPAQRCTDIAGDQASPFNQLACSPNAKSVGCEADDSCNAGT